MYGTKHTNLQVYIQSYKDEPIGCGYYYIVTSGAASHTAFRTKIAFLNWLKQTGLKLDRRIGRTILLRGEYTRYSVMQDQHEFFKNFSQYTPFYALDNGDYTIGFYEETEQGNNLYIPNPNTNRPILNHRQVQKHLETNTPLNRIYL